MGPPVRVVCRGCLRSVEIDDGGDLRPASDCPYCGQPIDSRSAGSGPTEASVSLFDSGDSTLGDLDDATDWVVTWSRGSLGRLDRFQLRERLGGGGFGEVYLAYDPRLDRDVAIKILRESNPSERAMERFFREARAAARLDHPNIVGVYDAGFDKGRCWVAYQYVAGRPLWRHRDCHRITPVDAARMFRDLALAVDYAHQRGVVHRDLKPANILIDDLGRPRLIDFGLARRPDLDSDLTRDGAVVGTPAYMSPEQALGLGRRVDERSDVFSLGVILLETLTGERSETALARKTNGGAIPKGLGRILKRATAGVPAERYPTAAALAHDLDDWLREQEKPKTRSPLRGPLLVASAMLIASLGFWSSFFRDRGPEPETQPTARLLTTVEPPSEAAAQSSSRPPGAPALKPFAFVENIRKKRYHLADCGDVKAMAESNMAGLADIDEAESKGLRPCENCRPDIPRDVDQDAPGAP